MRRMLSHTALVRLALVVLLASLGSAVLQPCLADDPPQLPQSFYGTVEIGGGQAPIDTEVLAQGTGVMAGPMMGNPITVVTAGHYGGSTPAEGKLVVQGSTLTNGQPIEFYVNGYKAWCATPNGDWQTSYPYNGGGITELNLKVDMLYLPFIIK